MVDISGTCGRVHSDDLNVTPPVSLVLHIVNVVRNRASECSASKSQ